MGQPNKYDIFKETGLNVKEINVVNNAYSESLKQEEERLVKLYEQDELRVKYCDFIDVESNTVYTDNNTITNSDINKNITIQQQNKNNNSGDNSWYESDEEWLKESFKKLVYNE